MSEDPLISQSNITAARKKGDKLLGTLTQDQILYLRHRAKSDLFFLAYSILGYNRLSPVLHGNLCSWFVRHKDKRFKEILLPRSHFKSTVCTVSHGIQIALPDDAGSAPWPENLGTNCRILIAHEVTEKAAKFLFEISQHYLANPLLMALFPECVSSAKTHKINKGELELPRTERWGEATYSIMGSGGRSQGLHFNYLKLDDIIGDKARDSSSEMQAAKDWFDNLQSFLSKFTEDHIDIVGTRWSFDDVYAHANTRYGKNLYKYIRGAEEVVGGKLVPIFPEEFTSDSFDVLKKNKVVWAAQYANDPTTGSTEFQQSWKKFFTFDGPNAIRVRSLSGTSKRIDVADLDIIFLIDPAVVGKAGFIVTGMDYEGNVYTLEALKDEWRPTDLTDLVFKLYHRWRPRLVVVEKVLFSAVFENYWHEAMKNRGVSFRIEALGTENKAKEARIYSLANYFAAGQIYFHPDQKAIIEEFDQFGASDNVHMLDALAQGPKVWRKGVNMRQLAANAEAESRTDSGKSLVGGY